MVVNTVRRVITQTNQKTGHQKQTVLINAQSITKLYCKCGKAIFADPCAKCGEKYTHDMGIQVVKPLRWLVNSDARDTRLYEDEGFSPKHLHLKRFITGVLIISVLAITFFVPLILFGPEGVLIIAVTILFIALIYILGMVVVYDGKPY